jgi:hypothetical protein
MFVFFVLGWPFEWPVIILVFLPIVLPVVEKLQLGLGKLDLLIWFGALTAVNMQTAYLSPPVAMSAYYLRNVSSAMEPRHHLQGHGRLHDYSSSRHNPAADLAADRALATAGGEIARAYPDQIESSLVRVMRGLDPRIHLLRKKPLEVGWIAGSSPAMTPVCGSI